FLVGARSHAAERAATHADGEGPRNFGGVVVHGLLRDVPERRRSQSANARMIEERLLVLLRDHANPRGIVTMRGSALVQRAEAQQDEVDLALGRLAKAGLLTILAPFPFLVVKLRSWSGKTASAPVSAPSAYSYGKLSSKHVKDSYSPGADDALL